MHIQLTNQSIIGDVTFSLVGSAEQKPCIPKLHHQGVENLNTCFSFHDSHIYKRSMIFFPHFDSSIGKQEHKDFNTVTLHLSKSDITNTCLNGWH